MTTIDNNILVPAMCREYLGAFACLLYKNFQTPRHIKVLLKTLRQVERGDIKRLLISMPPRFGKSQLSSLVFPCWYMGRNPTDNVMFSTYSQEFANDFGRTVRNHIASEEYKAVFPQSALSKDSFSVSKFSNNSNGAYFAIGASGAITGRGSDLLIIDDIHKNRQEANSPTIVKNIIDWFSSTVYTRLSPNGKAVIIGTRWSEDDLIGYLLKKEPEKWTYLSFPAISDDNESLWPERWPVERLLNIKETMGTSQFEALYQQRPAPVEGSIIKKQWIRTYTALPQVKSYSWSWDTAIKTGEENDYSVGTLWAECDNGYYLVDLYREKLEYPDLRKTVYALYNKCKAHEVLIEDKASGQQILQDFKRVGSMPLIPVMPGKNIPKTKEERLVMVSPLFEAGKVFLPEKAEFLFDYIHELTSFPYAKHDDMVDSTTQYLNQKQYRINTTPKLRAL